MRNRTEIGYRMAAAAGATQIGLTIVVYDAIAADLHRAAFAANAGAIEARCGAVNHALLLIGHLQSWIESSSDAALRGSLTDFYSMLRVRILQLQVEKGGEGLTALANLVCDTRAAWKAKEQALLMERAQTPGSQGGLLDVDAPARSAFAWSA